MNWVGIAPRIRSEIDLESMAGQQDEDSFARSARLGETEFRPSASSVSPTRRDVASCACAERGFVVRRAIKGEGANELVLHGAFTGVRIEDCSNWLQRWIVMTTAAARPVRH
jgi:hypothetical protein